MRRGYATAFALNGSAAIHDFEIALAGHTSEDVEAVLPDGRFGSAEETGREMNRRHRAKAIATGSGMGEALGRRLTRRRRSAHARRSSLLLSAYRAGDSRDGARGGRHRYAAHASGGRRRGDRQRHASRFPPVLLAWSPNCTTAASI